MKKIAIKAIIIKVVAGAIIAAISFTIASCRSNRAHEEMRAKNPELFAELEQYIAEKEAP